MQQPVSPLGSQDLILCDFDGTISVVDTGLLVAETLGLDRFDEIEQSWRRGEISARECLRDQWRLIDPQRPDFREIIATLEIDPGVRDLVSLAQRHGARLVVLSDGLDFYIEAAMKRIGLPDVEFRANHAVLCEDRVEMEFPHGAEVCEECGNCKTHWLFELRAGYTRVIYIGDGISDGCASRYCDLVFAKDLLAQACRERGQEFIPFETLSDVVAVLSGSSQPAAAETE
jgi:2-hydroxy-3-keto-5-methylthiopentenyl-1-phosphate phosphatase